MCVCAARYIHSYSILPDFHRKSKRSNSDGLAENLSSVKNSKSFYKNLLFSRYLGGQTEVYGQPTACPTLSSHVL